QEHDSEALGAGRRSAEDVGAAVVARQHGVGHEAGHDHIGQAVPADVGLDLASQRAVADHDETALWHAGLHPFVSAQKIPETLSLLEPSDEQDVDAAVTQVPDRCEARLESVDVDTVRNDTQREFWKVLIE